MSPNFKDEIKNDLQHIWNALPSLIVDAKSLLSTFLKKVTKKEV